MISDKHGRMKLNVLSATNVSSSSNSSLQKADNEKTQRTDVNADRVRTSWFSDRRLSVGLIAEDRNH